METSAKPVPADQYATWGRSADDDESAQDELRRMPLVLTSREVAQVLRVGVREVRLLVASGKLAGARLGPRKVIRISKVALLSLLKVRGAL